MMAYAPGSKLIAVPLVLLIIPFFALSRSPSRYELEAEVIEAIRDNWPEAAPLGLVKVSGLAGAASGGLRLVRVVSAAASDPFPLTCRQ